MDTQILSGGTTSAGRTGRETASAQTTLSQSNYRAGAKSSVSFSEFVEQDNVKAELTDAVLIAAPTFPGDEEASEPDVAAKVPGAEGDSDIDVSVIDGKLSELLTELADGSAGGTTSHVTVSAGAEPRVAGAMPVKENANNSARTGEMAKAKAGPLRESGTGVGSVVSESIKSNQDTSVQNEPTMDLKTNSAGASSRESMLAEALLHANFGQVAEARLAMGRAARHLARQTSEIPSSQSLAGAAMATKAMEGMAKPVEPDLKDGEMPHLQVVNHNASAGRRFTSRIEDFDMPQAQLRRAEGFEGMARFVQNASSHGANGATLSFRDPTFMSNNGLSADFEPGTFGSTMDIEGLPRDMPGTSHSPGVSSTLRVEAARMPFAQIADQIVRNPDKSIDIALSPKELGHVRMQLATTDGALTIIVTAERAETTELMRRHMDSLLQEFRKLGFEHAGFEFRQQGHGAQGGEKANNVASLTIEAIAPPEGGVPADKAPPRAPTSAGLDIRI